MWYTLVTGGTDTTQKHSIQNVGQLEKRRVRSELLSQYLVEPVEKSTLFYILEI